MKKLTILFAALFIFIPIAIAGTASNLSGYILLQVQKNGEAWYVYPVNGERYFLGRPDDAFSIMKKLALGATHNYITNTEIFPARLSGMILLDVERNGEAYYIYPKDNKKYYLGWPTDAFRIMSQLGLGISNSNLAAMTIGNINNPVANSVTQQNVPFTSQAPFGTWSDLRQEDGCEEASSFMAVQWARGKTFTGQEALDNILGSSDYTLQKYGEYRDISATDTLNWIIKDYFKYPNAALKTNATKQDIINELKKGNVIIAPMNGQALHNPNFVQPGPKHHMLLIKGYDPVKDIFITNDPGTRKGNSYIYPTDLLYNAIRDYQTGIHQPDSSTEKTIIVVWE